MPKGPEGQKRSVDVTGSTMVVTRSATEEIIEDLKRSSGRVRKGIAAAETRVGSMMKGERSAAAKQATTARGT